MPKSEITITELSEFEPTRVDGVGKGANGFPILMLKGIETDVTAEVLAAVEAAKAADTRPDCETCKGSGKIMAGNRKCPDCQATGKKPMIGDTTKTLAEAAKAGVAPSGSGPTPATDCPTCKGDGILRDGTHDGKQCPDCGGTGKDQATTNPIELRTVNAGDGTITEGDAQGRERIDKAEYTPAPYHADADETVKCPGCGLMNDTDSKYCDQCGMKLAGATNVSMKAEMSGADINDLPDSAFAYIEDGGKKDSDGNTVPRSLRHFPIHDAAHVRNALARAAQSDFGDKAMPAITAAAKKFGITVAQKADGSMTYAAANPSIAASTTATTGVSVTPDGSSDASPGSPAWEAVDTATATAAATALMQASELIRTFAQRERMEVAAGEGNDVFDAGAAEAAMVAVSQALGIMAQLAFHEGLEAQKGQVEKAGKRLAGKTIAALAAARDHLNTVLGSDDPALATQDSGDGTDGNNAADKFIASANKALDSERNVLDMTEEELQQLVVNTVAQAVVVAEATKGKAYDDNVDGIAGGKAANKKSKKKNPKADLADLVDEADHGDNDSGSMDAAKAEMTPEEIEANLAAKAARKELKAAKKAAKAAAKQASVTKAVETALAEVAKQTDGLNATIEKLTTDLDTVKKMAAPSSIVRTRPQEALTKSAERDALELDLAKYENLAKSTNEPELRTGYNERVKQIRTQIAAL